MTEPTGSLRAALAGEVRGIASVIRAFLNDEAWGGADMARQVAATLDRAVVALAQPAPPTEATEARAREVLAKHGLAVLNGSLAHRANVELGEAVMGAMIEFADHVADAGKMIPTEATPPHDGLLAGQAFLDAFDAAEEDGGNHLWLVARRAADEFRAALSTSEVQPAPPMTPEDAREVGRIEGLEEAAKICDERAAGRERLYAENGGHINALKSCEAEDAATAIRAHASRVGDGRGDNSVQLSDGEARG